MASVQTWFIQFLSLHGVQFIHTLRRYTEISINIITYLLATSFFNFNFSRRKLIPVYEIIMSNDLPLGLRYCVNVINQNGLPEIRLA